jgi:hypothetical protein
MTKKKKIDYGPMLLYHLYLVSADGEIVEERRVDKTCFLLQQIWQGHTNEAWSDHVIIIEPC